jgi:hypothetical protein
MRPKSTHRDNPGDAIALANILPDDKSAILDLRQAHLPQNSIFSIYFNA